MRATQRLLLAIGVLREINHEIEREWQNYHERPSEAKDVETSIATALVDLERCQREEAPELDKLVARMGREHAALLAETFDRR